MSKELSLFSTNLKIKRLISGNQGVLIYEGDILNA